MSIYAAKGSEYTRLEMLTALTGLERTGLVKHHRVLGWTLTSTGQHVQRLFMREDDRRLIIRTTLED